MTKKRSFGCNRPSGFDFGAYASFVGCEIFSEKIRKLLCRCIKGCLVGSNIAGNQYFGRHVWAFAHHFEAEHRIALSFRLAECSAMDGVDDRASVGQLDALPGAIGSPAPPSVHQPNPCTVLFHLGGKQFCVFVWMPHKKRAENVAEGSFTPISVPATFAV